MNIIKRNLKSSPVVKAVKPDALQMGWELQKITNSILFGCFDIIERPIVLILEQKLLEWKPTRGG